MLAKVNAKVKTFENTYYFSYTTGDKNKTQFKQAEVMREPAKTSEMMLGFDGDVV